jgi:hypothetical protein
MNYLKWLLAGMVGSAVGAVIWVAVGHYAEAEVGYIAWAVGLFAGMAVRWAAGPEEGIGPAIAAVITAVFGIAVAKYEVISLHVDKLVAQALVNGAELTDNDQISILADEIVEAKIASNEKIAWPAGDGDDQIVTKADYPPEIWTAAETRWKAMTTEEKQQRDADRQQNFAERLAVARQQIKQQAFQASFGPYDLLWFGLAAVTAFRIGRGKEDHDGEAAPAAAESDPEPQSPPVA